MTLRKACLLIVAVAAFNFVAFVVVATALGGDAVNGKTENGRYFLYYKGNYTEVSRGVFTYSRLHVYSIFLTCPLLMISLLVLEIQKRKAKRAS